MNSGDGIDYHQRFGENIGDLIQVGLLGSINSWQTETRVKSGV